MPSCFFAAAAAADFSRGLKSPAKISRRCRGEETRAGVLEKSRNR
jgi:hypothetical protein